jgi:hypothetical protein
VEGIVQENRPGSISTLNFIVVRSLMLGTYAVGCFGTNGTIWYERNSHLIKGRFLSSEEEVGNLLIKIEQNG